MQMYIETRSADELTRLLDERGYSSLEAREIQKEMELAKEEYDMVIRCRGNWHLPSKNVHIKDHAFRI
mgnify:CR=1 FL=1